MFHRNLCLIVSSWRFVDETIHNVLLNILFLLLNPFKHKLKIGPRASTRWGGHWPCIISNWSNNHEMIWDVKTTLSIPFPLFSACSDTAENWLGTRYKHLLSYHCWWISGLKEHRGDPGLKKKPASKINSSYYPITTSYHFIIFSVLKNSFCPTTSLFFCRKSWYC